MRALDRRGFLATTAAGLSSLPRRARAASADDDPIGVRKDFPVTEELAYLNTASAGPLSKAAHEALVGYAEEKLRFRNAASRRNAQQSARKRFASLFGTHEDEVAFLYNTSDGENIVASSIDWRPGDNVVLDELHFTTSFVLYRQLEERFGIELRVVRPRAGVVTVDDYDARVNDRTRLLSVAWVSNRNGLRYDLPALADLVHARGGYLYADAIQALGQFPTSLHDEKVDFACANSYKWLHADFGCAPFFVRREHLSWVEPDRFGHRQVAKRLPESRFELAETAVKYEHANAAYGPVTALDAALDYLSGVGLERIERHIIGLAGELRAGVDALGFDLFTPPNNPSPIVSFYHGMEPNPLYDALQEAGVAVTFQEEGRLIRAAVAMFNNRDDVDRLLAVLRARA